MRYDDSPQRLDEFVSVDEVDGLLADEARFVSRDPRRVAHLLRRVRSTLVAMRSQVQSLHREVQEMQISRSSLGQPTTLDPRTAAQFLSPEQFAEIGDQLVREKLEAASRIESDARAYRSEMVRRVNVFKFVVSGVLEDHSVPADVRAKLSAALSRLPDEPAAPPPVPYDPQVAAALESAPPAQPTRDELDDLFG